MSESLNDENDISENAKELQSNTADTEAQVNIPEVVVTPSETPLETLSEPNKDDEEVTQISPDVDSENDAGTAVTAKEDPIVSTTPSEKPPLPSRNHASDETSSDTKKENLVEETDGTEKTTHNVNTDDAARLSESAEPSDLDNDKANEDEHSTDQPSIEERPVTPELSEEDGEKAKLSPSLPPRTPVGSRAGPRLPPLTPGSDNVSQPPNLPNRGEKQVYAVPPPLSEELKTPEFRKNVADIESKSLGRSRVSSPIDSAAEINLIANRYRVTSHQLEDQPASKRENIEEGQLLLKNNYTTILEQEKEEAPYPEENNVSAPEDRDGQEVNVINWTFWTSVVNDFSSVANKEAFVLEAEITKGIPRQIRGIIWQLIANSKSKEFEDIFETLQDTESPQEASIKRDLKRTNFIPQDKVDSLFNLLKVYSVYDPDVGYTQGMGFITAPLLLNCQSEADAFGLLIVIMKNYGIREFFMPEMPGLMLLLYQFDRVLEENSPTLFNHLAREGIKSSMYATQWFLTFFAYKFPLEFVLRIFDIILFEGYESILKFAVNLMLKNSDIMINLKFDNLLNFLKNGLFEYYSKEAIAEREASPDQSSTMNVQLTNSNHVDRVEQTVREYDVDLFVRDAMAEVHITPISLRRYKEEYKEIHQLQREKEDQYEALRIQNKQLEKEEKKLNHEYAQLNKEHLSMASTLIENRLSTETLLDENNDLKKTIEELNQQLQEEKEKASIPNPDSALPVNLKKDMERTMERNDEVTSENKFLQSRIKELELHVRELRAQNKEAVRNAATQPHSPRHDATDDVIGEPTNEDASLEDVPIEPPVQETKMPSLSGGWRGFKNVFKKE